MEAVENAEDRPMRLTRDAFEAGAPCPGCGMPRLADPHDIYEFVGTKNETPKQTARREAEEGAFRQRHPDCRRGQWSTSGSWVKHCLGCCPLPPLSDQQVANIATILSTVIKRQAAQAALEPPSSPIPPKPKSKKQRIAELEAEVADLRARLDGASSSL